VAAFAVCGKCRVSQPRDQERQEDAVGGNDIASMPPCARIDATYYRIVTVNKDAIS
jgi:hypothetical protein